MKVRTGSQIGKAVREFTDREEPRKSFWKKYNEVKLAFSEEQKVNVLSYYGIGGIGKTRLLNKLIEEMESELKAPLYVYVDFACSQDSCYVLEKIKTMLCQKCKFDFPLFDLGLYIYYNKIGEKPESIEVKQLINKSPLLNLIISVLGNIPVVGILTKVLSLLDQSRSVVLTYLKLHTKEITFIEEMNSDELYNYLPLLFSLDMQHNMENTHEPVVFFLDTYEALVNEQSHTGYSLLNDEWLRGENGIIQNIPGVLWVIAGREKLKWENFDIGWKESLEQHMLGSLSETDSIQFLTKCGIAGEQLRYALYKLTDGTPIYLDICVDRYMRILEAGQVPEFSMFGGNTEELVERFVRYMGDAQKDMVYMLVCLRSWTDELIDKIGGMILKNFSDTTYDTTKQLSFILCTDDGRYMIHKTVADVLSKNCPRSLSKRAGKVLMDYFSGVSEETDLYSQDFTDALLYNVCGSLLCFDNRDEFREYYENNIEPYIIVLIRSAQYKKIYSSIELLGAYACKSEADLLYADWLKLMGVYAQHCGNTVQAKDFYTVAVSLFRTLLGNDDVRTLSARYCLGQLYIEMQEYESVIDELLTVLDDSVRVLGEDDEFTLIVLSSLAYVLFRTGYCDQAIKLNEEIIEMFIEHHCDDVYLLMMLTEHATMCDESGRYDEALNLRLLTSEYCQKIYGEDHADTIVAKNNLAISYQHVGKYEEALALFEYVLKKRSELLGENHILTLSTLSNKAKALSIVGKNREATELNINTYTSCCKVLGERHELTLKVAHNMGENLYVLGAYEESCSVLTSVLKMWSEEFGDQHPETIKVAKSLLKTLEKLECLDEAQELQELLEEYDID